MQQPSRFSYNAAVSACAWSGDYETVAQLMREMTADGVAPVSFMISQLRQCECIVKYSHLYMYKLVNEKHRSGP
jgi:pentatricopeptide repeat protein